MQDEAMKQENQVPKKEIECNKQNYQSVHISYVHYIRWHLQLYSSYIARKKIDTCDVQLLQLFKRTHKL
jgi:hypothetical protein